MSKTTNHILYMICCFRHEKISVKTSSWNRSIIKVKYKVKRLMLMRSFSYLIYHLQTGVEILLLPWLLILCNWPVWDIDLSSLESQYINNHEIENTNRPAFRTHLISILSFVRRTFSLKLKPLLPIHIGSMEDKRENSVNHSRIQWTLQLPLQSLITTLL